MQRQPAHDHGPFYAGEANLDLYIVTAGVVYVYRHPEGVDSDLKGDNALEPAFVTTLGEGQFFGEGGVLFPDAEKHTVSHVADPGAGAEVVYLRQEDMIRLIRVYPELGRNLAKCVPPAWACMCVTVPKSDLPSEQVRL
jgi:CRP-like cAMP-binding protein